MYDETQFSQDEGASISADNITSEAQSFASDNNTTPETEASAQANQTGPNPVQSGPTGGTTPPPGGFPPPPAYSPYQFGQQPAFSNQTPPPKPPKNFAKSPKDKKKFGVGKKFLLAACLGIVFGICAGGAFFGITKFTNLFDNTSSDSNTFLKKSKDTASNSGAVTTSTTYAEINTDISQVAKDVMPSIVSITTVSVTEYQSFFGYSFPQESQGAGSGVIVGTNDNELLIVTNNHVVSGANSLTVTFADDEIASAQIKGTDANMDLAVIAVPLKDIKDETMDAIAFATIGDSSSLSVGEPAIAIGNALGYGQSVTSGIISALEREVTVDNVTSTLIQTDAAINPGNSGGALLNIKGELIGINSVKYSSTEVEGMGYAIPISSAMPIIEKLMVRETKTKAEESGYLGISGADVTEDAVKIYNLPAGVCVTNVVEGLAADKAGIKRGDIITEIEGTSITTMKALRSELEYYSPGETVSLKVQVQSDKGYAEKQIDVTLSENPEK